MLKPPIIDSPPQFRQYFSQNGHIVRVTSKIVFFCPSFGPMIRQSPILASKFNRHYSDLSQQRSSQDIGFLNGDIWRPNQSITSGLPQLKIHVIPPSSSGLLLMTMRQI
jgi:hypothetical protein